MKKTHGFIIVQVFNHNEKGQVNSGLRQPSTRAFELEEKPKTKASSVSLELSWPNILENENEFDKLDTRNINVVSMGEWNLEKLKLIRYFYTIIS